MPGLGEALRSQELLDRIEEILMACAVVPSAGLGLLGDITKLAVAGDGSSLYSGAVAGGRAMCRCEQRSCDCDRLHSDPFATWGWDSHREQNRARGQCVKPEAAALTNIGSGDRLGPS